MLNCITNISSAREGLVNIHIYNCSTVGDLNYYAPLGALRETPDYLTGFRVCGSDLGLLAGASARAALFRTGFRLGTGKLGLWPGFSFP